RQPEFTQIDCEMAFVEQEDILNTFEGLTKHLFKEILNTEMPVFPRMDYATAMSKYGSDKPDIRFGMEITDISNLAKGKGYKFFEVEQLEEWCKACGAKPGDMLLALSGDLATTQKQIGELRLHLGKELNLRHANHFAPLWVVDFPLMEYDAEEGRHFAMHHPFTSPKPEDIHKLETATAEVRANAYDLVINGVEIGGGSIRIHDRELQAKMFDLLGFTREEAQEQFGFLMNAFEY